MTDPVTLMKPEPARVDRSLPSRIRIDAPVRAGQLLRALADQLHDRLQVEVGNNDVRCVSIRCNRQRTLPGGQIRNTLSSAGGVRFTGVSPPIGA